MDLLKNMLFMQVNENQFASLNVKWKSMIDTLEKNGEKPLRFLRYYLTATYDISDVKQDFQGIINEDDIYNWLLKSNDKCHYKDAPISSYLKTANEIEHIMPVTCTDISTYKMDTHEEYELYKSKLGNLTLLEKTLNATIHNDA